MIAVAKQLEGKIALITGATSGIGRVAALELAAQGAELYLGPAGAFERKPTVLISTATS